MRERERIQESCSKCFTHYLCVIRQLDFHGKSLFSTHRSHSKPLTHFTSFSLFIFCCLHQPTHDLMLNTVNLVHHLISIDEENAKKTANEKEKRNEKFEFQIPSSVNNCVWRMDKFLYIVFGSRIHLIDVCTRTAYTCDVRTSCTHLTHSGLCKHQLAGTRERRIS